MTSWYTAPRAVFALSMLALSGYAAVAPASSHGRGLQQDFDWNGEIAPGATLRVFTTAGTVTVRQAAGRTARVHGETRDADDEQIRYLTDRDGGDVRICAVREGGECNDNGVRDRDRGWSRRNRRAKANFTIEVPRGVVVRVGSGNGDVTVDGATADVNASSGNGDVRVGSGAARVDVSSGNGAVMVDAARGPVHASTGNGRVMVSTAQGPVEASSGNGSIDVSMASLRGDDDMEFSSGNGSITLRVPADFSAEIEASTGNGGFESDFPLRVVGRMSQHRVHGTIGSGGRSVRMSTGNGSIRVLRAGT
ncbi:MAG TPA: DUF4097 family beta strand repeat-containing protein [Longimicrobium sp.]|jgi:hypothetical protein